jgi:hypothetical protein
MSDDEAYSIADQKRLLAAKFDNRKGARKARRQKLNKSVDGRSLRQTGRVEQFNFRCTPGLHQKATEIAAAAGMSLAEWMENTVEAAIEASRGKNNA